MNPLEIMNQNGLTKIFLARHGESEANQKKLISGQLDTPLTEKGKQQAQCLNDVLQGEQLTAIYTSTLQRTIETAMPTAQSHGLEIQAHAELMEMNFGRLQGRKHDQFNSDYPAVLLNQNIDGQESDAEEARVFESRINRFLEETLKKSKGAILIVGHRKVNEHILARILRFEPNLLFSKSVNIKNKYLYQIELGDNPSVCTIRLGGEFHGKKFVGIKDD